MTRRALIVGHGAIGSVFAGALAQSDFEVHALSSAGVGDGHKSRRLLYANEPLREYAYSVVGRAQAREPYDVIVLSVKTTALAGVPEAVAKSVGENTTLISAMNGIPWWFAKGAAGESSLQAVRPSNIVGCVIKLAATKVSDDEVEMRGNRQLIFGDIVPESSRAAELVSLLNRPWLECRQAPDIRGEVWRKLLNNASVNPVSALCMANCGQVTGDAGARIVIRQVMQEVIDVGIACGVRIDADIEACIDWSASYGAFKTSMLQDLEAGRALEVDALLTSVIALGERFGVPTPYLSCVTSLVALRSKLNLSHT